MTNSAVNREQASDSPGGREIPGAGPTSAAPDEALRSAGLTRIRLIRPSRGAGASAQDLRRPLPSLTPIATWLEHLGRALPRMVAADVVHVPMDASAPQRLAAWPEAGARGAETPAAARRAVEAAGCVVEPTPGDPHLHVIAVPLVAAGLPRAAVVAYCEVPADSDASADVRDLLQATGWLRPLLDAGAGDTGSRDALELLVAALEHRDLRAAAAAVVNRLAATVQADRVCLGSWDGRRIELLAVSGSAAFDPSTALSAAVRDAMEESVRQRATLVVPEEAATAPREDAAQRVLMRQARAGSVCTVPFADGATMAGAATFEWAERDGMDAGARDRCTAALALVGPVLATMRRAELGFAARVRAGLQEGLRRAAGPRRPFLKLALTMAAAALVFASLVSGIQRVAGEAVLRGAVQRVVLAPVDGFIATAPARPGDVVEADAVLATLDDQALRLEVAKWQADYDRLLNEYREAMALLDSARVSVLRAELDRAGAELELAESNLARSEIRTPIAGVVVSGDFSQSLGAPVERGATLFELAPLDGYRVSVRVRERDVARLEPGQPGRLRLQALPGEALGLVVERITPVSEVVDGQNVFEVEARLLDAPDALRPGMQGVAKFEVGEARLLWLWTHDAFDWLRLRLWSLGLAG